jgi:lactoylglutathione lyase
MDNIVFPPTAEIRQTGGNLLNTPRNSMAFTSENLPGVVADTPEATKGFVLNHSMLRVKDPAVSLAFYTGVIGMRVLRKLDFPEMKFSLYFLAKINDGAAVPESVGERTEWTFSQRGILELTHNWGTEDDPDFKYHDGNAQPQGFGHICFSVPDLAAAIRWFDENKVTYVKRPEQGKMKDVAFIKDPDGYWIEIVQPSLTRQLGQS